MPRADQRPLSGRYEDSPQAGRTQVFVNEARVIVATHQFHRVETADFPLTALREKVSEIVASNVDFCWRAKACIAKDDVEEISSDVPSCRVKAMSAYEHNFRKRHHSDLLSLSTTVVFSKFIKLSLADTTWSPDFV